ncbi:MAG: UDPGP type 1 family protein [Planctomycetota bacterium]
MEDSFEFLKARYAEAQQAHVFKGFDKLSPAVAEKFKAQLARIDLDLVERLFTEYSSKAATKPRELRPAETVRAPATDKEKAEFRKAYNRGEELLKAGKVAAFLVAGGQGSRLGLPGPKGTFPVYPITGRSLFEVFALKLLNLRGKYGKCIPLYIMTSPENNEETRTYFEAFNYFGLEPSSVRFVVQGTLPALDLWGKLVLDSPGHIFESPNGHGGAIEAMRDSGMIRSLLDQGYEELFYFQVDNVLVRICDPAFIGLHNLRRADMSTKVVEKVSPDEKVGIVGYLDGVPGVIEYSELSHEQLHERRKDGRLRYNAGNTAIHVFSLSFLDNLITGGIQLPYHSALKKLRCIDGQEIEVIKFERFIFDAMKAAGRVVVFEVDRAEEFSPLKNAVGPDSPNTVRNSLISMWARWLENAGVTVPRHEDGSPAGSVEISPLFADSADELKSKLPSGWEYRDGLVL